MQSAVFSDHTLRQAPLYTTLDTSLPADWFLASSIDLLAMMKLVHRSKETLDVRHDLKSFKCCGNPQNNYSSLSVFFKLNKFLINTEVIVSNGRGHFSTY
jgi:hypothetical protein